VGNGESRRTCPRHCEVIRASGRQVEHGGVETSGRHGGLGARAMASASGACREKIVGGHGPVPNSARLGPLILFQLVQVFSKFTQLLQI
jgi:hypothetical protein